MSPEEYNQRVSIIENQFIKSMDQKQRLKELKELNTTAETEYKRAYLSLYNDLVSRLPPITMNYVTTGRSSSTMAPKTKFTLAEHIAMGAAIRKLFHHPCKTPDISKLRIKLDRYRDHLSILCKHEYPKSGIGVYYGDT